MITEFKLYEYIYDKDIETYFMFWFKDKFKDKMLEQGWTINNIKLFKRILWNVEKTKDSKISTDQLFNYAKDCGLVLDNDGFIIGYNNILFE